MPFSTLRNLGRLIVLAAIAVVLGLSSTTGASPSSGEARTASVVPLPPENEAGSETPQAPSSELTGYVSPPSTPTEVELGLHVVGISHIDPPSHPFPSFTVEGLLDLTWRDQRLAFDPDEKGVEREVFQNHAAQLVLEQLWWPDIQFENEEGSREIESSELVLLPDGTATYTERFSAKIHTTVDLRRFPFDSQVFVISVESFAWDQRYMRLSPKADAIGYDDEFQTLEWNITDFDFDVGSSREPRSEVHFSHIDFRIHAQRDSGFYIWKIAIPLLLIVVFSWSSFWMTDEPSPSRMQRSYIALLTVVAFHQVVSSNLPRISYLTFMDCVVYVAFASVGLTLIQIVLLHREVQSGRAERARWLDRRAKVVVPLSCFLALVILWFAYHG